MARQLRVDLGQVRGTGPGGRIQAADVRQSAVAAPVGAATAGAPLLARGEVKATPLARRIAAAEGIDLHTIPGSGPEGTITREDVEAAVRGQALGAGAGVSHQFSVISNGDHAIRNTHYVPRRDDLLDLPAPVIGERMSQSAASAPHVTLMTEAEATNLVSARFSSTRSLR